MSFRKASSAGTLAGRVLPGDGKPPPSPVQGRFKAIASAIYVVTSLAGSIWYLYLLDPVFSNDIWWINYTPSGDQALLIDLVNQALVTQASGSFDLLAPSASMDKTYTTVESTTNVNPTYPRSLILAPHAPDFAVQNLRAMSVHWVFNMYTQFCWVDVAHEFEVAHTAARQARCYGRYSANGAMYLETIVRNQVWADFELSYGGPGGSFSVPFQNWIDQVKPALLTSMATALATTTVEMEVAYWLAHNITYFQTQWQNEFQPGVAETMQIENALGQVNEITLKKLSATNEIWTSANLFWSNYFDESVAAPAGASLIRSASNFLLASPQEETLEALQGLYDAVTGDYVNQSGVFRTTIGTFESVDTFYVGVPHELLTLVSTFQHEVFAILDTNNHVLDGVGKMQVAPMPSAWQGYMYGGGNLMCMVSTTTTSFPQQTFSFYDACDKVVPLTLELTIYSSLFAVLAADGTFSSHTTCQATASSINNTCVSQLDATRHAILAMPSVQTAMRAALAPAQAAVTRLNIALMQYAWSPLSNWTLLTQPLLDDPTFAFFGWTMLYDWVHGQREVVSFEGDLSRLVVISDVQPPLVFTSSTTFIGSSVRMLYYLTTYVTAILCAISILCYIWLVKTGFAVHGYNLAWFNYLVSSIWAGRPLLFVRGFTAVLMLSSTQVDLVTSVTRSKFAFAPRHLIHTMIVAGETTWILAVAIDCLTIATGRATKLYAPLSCAMAWLAITILESVHPVQPLATLDRKCTLQNMDHAVRCTAGVLEIGSFARVVLLFAILAAGLIGGIVLSSLYYWCVDGGVTTDANPTTTRPTRLLLGVGDVFLDAADTDATHASMWSMDKVSCIMVGLVPFSWNQRRYIFDVKLWLVQVDETTTNPYRVNFQTHARNSVNLETLQSEPPVVSTTLQRCLKTFVRVFGSAYVVGSLVGSVSYMQTSQVNLANDILWASFNMTGIHTFIGNWLNQELLLGVNHTATQLTLDSINMDGTFGSDNSAVASAANYGARLQHTDMATIEATIPGLRTTDACLIPWIFTQYCFVDFSKRWEMANSATRQRRCQQMTSNGAVYLEAMLRNIDYPAFRTCWGEAFDVAVAVELDRSVVGHAWMNNLTTPQLSFADEVTYWVQHGITSFNTQWQNFKQIGVSNAYAVQNAFGVQYPMTLQAQKYTFRVQKQTTFKMYWGFASDLLAVVQNSTTIGGRSLIRSSPTFAFLNATTQGMLAANGTLPWSIPSGLALIRDAVGPFGSIDMWYIACPADVITAVHAIVTALRQTLAHNATVENTTAQIAYDTVADGTSGIFPAPQAWLDLNDCERGGSPLCPEFETASCVQASIGLKTYFSFSMPCAVYLTYAVMAPVRQTQVAAVMLAGLAYLSDSQITTICTQDPEYYGLCLQYVNQTAAFVRTYMAANVAGLNATLVRANAAVRPLNLEFMQYGSPDMLSPLMLDRLLVFNPRDNSFDFFAWIFVVEWSLGLREGVQFEGDHGTLAVLSEPLPYLQQEVNKAEFPTSSAFYMRNAVLYITGMMLTMFTIVIVYTVLSRGHIEVLNLLCFQRIGAIVWVGRPLLFVRSLTAVGMLATATLKLDTNGFVTTFSEPKNPWYKILLSANELTWLVTIFNDIVMSLTKDFTSYYSAANSLLVWLFSFTLSYTYPIQHSLQVDKQCHVTQLDFQIVCHSGVVVIGQPMRIVILVLIVVGSNAFCYVVTRLLLKRVQSRAVHSIFLYSGVRLLFRTSTWTYNNVYYMDRMSAFLNGILSVRWQNVIYGLDVKLWHTFQIELTAESSIPVSNPLHKSAKHAIPLVLERSN
ncbi:Aste57867_16569 [Aphanomyces stellatus]|uniref:Aste57867_16559 protein n=1 Tax=Aphanomyces stellatus TaxID=120398 RepID=A0A485L8W2_9STRA|nr:hypothetical protein As57867_016502 [Aphanomyces stellatus]KAF0692358.1 hypothetical protein As57867_016512 [Aphanomyces stellatus]VFT93332.1 Aste57867_16559 [Aphanomyces stellatus]VFT93342.1 Aste57867_16569 [Aphanomyces stellatus]